jgi:AcrR family transcriptional regulator
MSKRTTSSPAPSQGRKRLTREQSKAQTRTRLIEVGRKHILQHGLGNAVAERIAEDAGYSRGAFYSNFEDKEDLFLAIMCEKHRARFTPFKEILAQEQAPRQLLRSLREAIVNRVTDPEWIMLQADFEAGALRSQKMQEAYLLLYREMLREGREIVRQLAKSPHIKLSLKANEFLLAMLAFSQGLTVNQRLLGAELPSSSAKKVIYAIFNTLVTSDIP